MKLDELKIKYPADMAQGGRGMADIIGPLKAISDRLKSQYGAQKVILYGSYATGHAGRDSDVDILVIAPAPERFVDRVAAVLRIVRDLYGGLALSPVVLRPEELEERLKIGDQFVGQILNEGIEL